LENTSTYESPDLPKRSIARERLEAAKHLFRLPDLARTRRTGVAWRIIGAGQGLRRKQWKRASHHGNTSGPTSVVARIAERAEVGENREALFAVTIPERQGELLEFCGALGHRSVTEFNYRLSSRSTAHVFIGVRVDGAPSALSLADSLRAKGYTCSDLTWVQIFPRQAAWAKWTLGRGAGERC
jgi:hypothetical protein